MGKWKAIRLGFDPSLSVELYDVTKDPGEDHDVAAGHPDVVNQARELFRTARTDSPDWPVPAPQQGKGKAKGGSKKKK